MAKATTAAPPLRWGRERPGRHNRRDTPPAAPAPPDLISSHPAGGVRGGGFGNRRIPGLSLSYGIFLLSGITARRIAFMFGIVLGILFLSCCVLAIV